MTERTIKEMAKELACIFHDDQARSDKFRKTFPTKKAYLRGQWHMPNGDIIINKPGWMYHVELARKLLSMMLGQSDERVSPIMKERIYDALIADADKQPQAKKVLQRKETTPLN